MEDYWILLAAAFGVLSFVMAKASALGWRQRGYVLRWKDWRSKLEGGCLALLALFSAFLAGMAGMVALFTGMRGVIEMINH